MRITVTVSDEVVQGLDEFARYTNQSRSAVVSAMLELSIPMLSEMRNAFDVIKSGGDQQQVVTMLREMVSEAYDSIDEIEEKIGSQNAANPSLCNNGGQVPASERPKLLQSADYKGVSSKKRKGGKNA